MDMVVDNNRGAKLKKHALGIACGAFLGFFGAIGVAGAAKEGLLGTAGASVHAALGVALIYLLMALVVGAGVLSPALGARFLNVEDAQELREERAKLQSDRDFIAKKLANPQFVERAKPEVIEKDKARLAADNCPEFAVEVIPD